MHTHSSRNRRPSRASRAVTGLLAIVASCATYSAWGQQPAVLEIQSAALPAPSQRLSFFTPQAIREGRAAKLSHYNSDQKLRLVLNLQPPHQAEEDAFVKDLVTKGSPGFHQFLTQDEWNSRFAPSAQDEQAVVDWAQSVGLTVTKRYSNRLLVDVEGTVGTIETAFGVSINNYQVGSEVDFSNDRNPVIPAKLNGILSVVAGMNNIERVHRMGSSGVTVKGADYVAGPAISELGSAHGKGDPTKAPWSPALTVNGQEKPAIKSASTGFGANDSYFLDNKNGTYAMDPSNVQSSQGYDYNALQRFSACCNETNPGSSAGSPPESSIALVGYGGFNTSDVDTFFGAYGMAYNLTWYCIDGSTCPSNDGEAPLDVEYSGAMSNSYGGYQNTAHIYEYEMTNNLWSTFEDAYNDVLNDGHAKVVSTSYGGNEDQNSTSAGIETGTMHSIFNNMVAAGITLIAASGDQGATAGCGAATAVQYPSSDPDVIAAGGTQLNMTTSGIFFSETAWQGETWSGACGSNHGGSTGGRSILFAAPYWQTITSSTYPTGVDSPFYSWQTVSGNTTEYSNTGFNSRLLPDISLTANPDVLGQWYYNNGGWESEGGTSIVAPELAGFFAQENSYLDTVGSVCGSGGTSACSPVGLASPFIYDAGVYGAPHNPFYDMTSGCNNNDVTVANNLFYYCAYTGFDPITGWGSANMMQLAWAINWQLIPAVGTPSLSFGGPATNTWFNTDQIVDWDLNDSGGSLPAPGALGFTLGWDTLPSDPQTQPHGGDGNSFYAGPQYLSTFGCVDNDGSLCEAASGQGCHTVYVEGWDNQGRTTTGSYGPVCFDSVAPVSSASLSGTFNGSVYTSNVTVTISSSDATSGVAHTYYALDGGGYVTYGGAFSVSALGSHTVLYYSKDNAGNSSSVRSVSFTHSTTSTTTLTSSISTSSYNQPITFTATVAPNGGGTATGTVSFLHGTTVLGVATLSGNVAKLVLSTLGIGSTHVTATYNGSSQYLTSTSNSVGEVVNKASTTTALTTSVNPSSYNQPVTMTATVTAAYGGTIQGTVTFYHGSTALGTSAVSGNVAHLAFPANGPGTTHVTATYNGSGADLTSTSASVGQVVDQAATTTTLTSSNNPSNHGESVTFTATVTAAFGGTVTGTVTFLHAGTVLGTANLTGGVAKLAVSSLGVGTNHIDATYAGGGIYATSTSAQLAQVVDTALTTTKVTSSNNPSAGSSSVTFTATVTAGSGATPTGTVAFKNGSSTMGTGTLNASGVATFTTHSLSTGTHSITAAYGGSSNDATSTSSTLTQTVD